MEQANRGWGTPKERQRAESPLARGLWTRGVPTKRSDFHLRRVTCQNGAQRLPFAVLPSHITPPSKLRKFRNPFESDLINRLHLSAISPTVFAKAPSPMQQSPGFTWSIEELAHIKPARIEESPVQQVSPDLELETRAQAAIDRFFNQNQIIPSPWDIRQKGSKLFLPPDTPNRLLNDFASPQEPLKSTKDAWSQTVLSLPLDLPSDVEEALKPFFTFTQEQNVDNDDVNSSNSSLRRKLFFCHDEGADNDNESFTSLSPVKINESMMLSCSPPESGMFVHGTPLKNILQTRRRSNGSSIVTSENLSPNISPIHDAETDRLYKRIEHCFSPTRLNFTVDTTTDDIAEKNNQKSINSYYSLDMSRSENNVKHPEDSDKLIIINSNKTNTYESINMEELSKCINSTDSIERSNVVFSEERNNEISLKILPKTANFSRENPKEINMMSGAFEQQSISNSVQDTGYQTHSMNSITHTIDSYNTSTKTLWNEQLVISKDNTQLSWRENINCVFSSTPSKYNKENGT